MFFQTSVPFSLTMPSSSRSRVNLRKSLMRLRLFASSLPFLASRTASSISAILISCLNQRLLKASGMPFAVCRGLKVSNTAGVETTCPSWNFAFPKNHLHNFFHVNHPFLPLWYSLWQYSTIYHSESYIYQEADFCGITNSI